MKRTSVRQGWKALALAFACAAMNSVHAAAAPPVPLIAPDGRPLSLETYRGRVVVLDFWASWCAPCRKSFPFFDDLLRRRGAEGLSVIGINLDEDAAAADAFLEAVPTHVTIAYNASGSAGEAFGVVAMPTTLLLDRDGTIVARFEGGDESVHARIDAAVATLLAGGTLATGTDVRVAAGLHASEGLKAWQRGHLADPIMSLDGDPLSRIIREHIHASKEAAAGDGGAAGGGCGCN